MINNLAKKSLKVDRCELFIEKGKKKQHKKPQHFNKYRNSFLFDSIKP
jgi:hypothetical protein